MKWTGLCAHIFKETCSCGGTGYENWNEEALMGLNEKDKPKRLGTIYSCRQCGKKIERKGDMGFDIHTINIETAV